MTTASADLELMRASARLDADPAGAAKAASGILRQFPDHEGAVLLLATAGRRMGDPQQAVDILRPLAEAQPGITMLQLELGRALRASGDRSAAAAAFERSIALDAGLADAWREIAALRFEAGDDAGGDAAYAQYTSLATEPPELADAQTALAEHRIDTAAILLRAHLETEPGDVNALRLYAQVMAKSGSAGEAESVLLKCLALAPGYAAARYELAALYNSQQRTDEVFPLLDRLLATDPGNRAYRILKAQALRFARRNAEARAVMESVIADHPHDPTALLVLGHLLREIGDRTAAIKAYRDALQLDVASAEAWWSLANLKTFVFGDEDRERIVAQAAKAPALGKSRIKLEFAIGKAYEDARMYEKSFEHYLNGNWLQRGTLDYYPDLMTAEVRRAEAIYTPRFFAEREGWGSEAADPIFVVGLPRSGSTLIEQILSSHPEVEGTRELLQIPTMVQEIEAGARKGDLSTYPESIATLSREEIQRLAAQYLAATREHRPLGRARFVDKMLANFAHIGLIHLMFPKATIIDARRHPLGCGFSCFKQLFVHGMPFSYNLGEIGRFYRDYFELMAHIDAVLPGRVSRVHYEAVVANPVDEVHRLLAHCGLEFDARCLKFYETDRAVMTISSDQVRRPIYADAVDQWRHYEPWLDQMQEALGDLVQRYPVFEPAAG